MHRSGVGIQRLGAQIHRSGVRIYRSGVVWSSKDVEGPQHRLQTANQGVQYIKGVAWFAALHRVLTTAMFKIPGSFLSCVSSGVWYPALLTGCASSPGVDCRPAMWQSVGKEDTSNIR
eukprot:2549477-Pyramimonas_sp.AAC.1